MAPRYDMVMERNTASRCATARCCAAMSSAPRPREDFPVLMTFGPYGKDVPLKEFMAGSLGRDRESLSRHPRQLLAASIWSGKRPIPRSGCRMATSSSASMRAAAASRRDGSRPTRRRNSATSTTRSNGRASQPWCSGKVGLTGISYHAAGQWRVASLKPPHLAALLPVDGHLRFLPRPHAPGRHLRQRLHLALVDAERAAQSARQSRDALSRSLYRRADDRRGRSLSTEQLAANRADYPRRDSRPSAQRRLLPGSHPRSQQESTCRSSWWRIGAGSRSICAARSAATSASPRPRNG